MNLDNIRTKQEAINKLKEVLSRVDVLNKILEIERKDFNRLCRQVSARMDYTIKWCFDKIRKDYITCEHKYFQSDKNGQLSLFINFDDLCDLMKNWEEFLKVDDCINKANQDGLFAPIKNKDLSIEVN